MSWSPFEDHPGQQWSNSIPSRVPLQLVTDTAGERFAFPALPADQSPPRNIVIVSMRLDAQHIQFETLPQPDAPQAQQQVNWREQFKRVLRGLTAPALYRRGDRHADLNFCGPLDRWSFQPLVQACKQASGSVTQTLKSLSWLVPFHGFNHDGRNVGNVRKAVGEIRNV